MSPKKATFLRKSSEPFLDYLDHWYSALPVISFDSLLKEIPSDQTAVLSVDVVNGFCKSGNLASPRISRIVNPIVQLFRNAEEQGIRQYVLLQDTHPADSKEFQIYPPHCVEGTEESQTVQELCDLPLSRKFKVIPKRTINPGIERSLGAWLDENDALRQFLVVGDCTDICVYLLALYLKTRSVARNVAMNVVVPANCVDTFEIPMGPETNAPLPHPGDLTHYFFLYHMQLNGIKVVAEIA
jgi:nicotinamidase-related amidase